MRIFPVRISRSGISKDREAEQHDKAVADYSPQMLEDTFNDLNQRSAHDRKNPEHRWIMARRSALVRRAQAIKKGFL